ncbi:MAG: AbrB/MazE/SpoVT family DNA-binding domain-containing protein [Candidatus Hodarchaeales archaeon]
MMIQIQNLKSLQKVMKVPKIYQNKSSKGSSWLVCLPKDLFRAKGIHDGDEVEFTLVNNEIVVRKKYNPAKPPVY